MATVPVRPWLRCIILAALTSCERAEAPADEKKLILTPPVQVEAAPAPPEQQANAFPACEGLGVSFELTGVAQEKVLERFGAPAQRESYRAGDRGGEFYVVIEATYPSKVPANRDVPIEEWTWTSGECILTVWFHRPNGVWIVLDEVYRNEEVAF